MKNKKEASMIRTIVIATALVLATTVLSNAATQPSAQRPYDPSVGSVGFKMTQQQCQRPYDPSAGSVGFKKSKKKKKKK
jgi:hypothetical protein